MNYRVVREFGEEKVEGAPFRVERITIP